MHGVSREGLLETVEGFLGERGRRTVLYANVHVLNQAVREPALREALAAADLVYCDGEGVRLGARLLGARLPPRSTGADFVWEMAGMCARRGAGIYWIGGAPGVAAAALDRLREAHPALRVCGAHHGFFEKRGAGTDTVIAEVNAAAPDLVVVGLGTPEQELWVARNRDALRAPVVWCLGATADFVAGRVPRAPRWMLDHGLEWLYRFAHEPRRLFGRYIVGNPIFFARVLRQRLGDARLTRRAHPRRSPDAPD